MLRYHFESTSIGDYGGADSFGLQRGVAKICIQIGVLNTGMIFIPFDDLAKHLFRSLECAKSLGAIRRFHGHRVLVDRVLHTCQVKLCGHDHATRPKKGSDHQHDRAPTRAP